MSTQVIRDPKIYVNGYNISPDLSDISLVRGAPLIEDTAFGATYHTMKPGLKTAKVKGAGFVQDGTGLVGTVLSGLVGQSFDLSICGENGATGGNAGDAAYFMKALDAQYEAGGAVGAMHKFQFSAEAPGSIDAPLVRGTIFEDGKTARTTAGNSSVYTLGAVAAGQKVYAILHLLAFTGTNVQFKVRSAVTNFATITDRITFTLATGVTSEFPAPVAGSITDTFWRVDWTGTLTSFNAVLLVGIQ